jgi:hypothetical protein
MVFARLADIDNDLRDSGKFVHHYFALLFVLLHFLEMQPSENCQKECAQHTHPAW